MVFLLSLPAYAAKKKPVNRPLTEEQKSLYAVGLVLARQLEVFDLTPAELRIVKRGLNDAAKGRKPKADFATYSKKSQELATTRRDAHGKKLASRVPVFIAHEAAREGAVTTASGLIFQSLREGEGEFPKPTDKVKLHFRSSLIDGKEMESTYKSEPGEFVVEEVTKCLAEGVQLMKQGGKAKLVCPPEIALGKEGNGIVPPDSTIVFDVELLELKK